MYHVVVRDPKGRALPPQITNYQHDHRGASVRRPGVHVRLRRGRETRHVHARGGRPPPRRPMRPVSTRAWCPSASTTWPGRTTASRIACTASRSTARRRPAASACAAAASTCGRKRVSYPIVDRWYAKGHDQFHKDEEGEGLDLYSIGGSRGAGGTGVWDGTKLWTSDNFVDARCCRTGRGARHSSSPTRPGMRARIGKVSETKQFTVDCGRNFDAVREHVRFRAATKPWSASASPNIRRLQVFPRQC